MGIMKKPSFVTGYKNFFDQKELKRMNLSVQRLVVELFKFNNKNIRGVYVSGEECLVSRDVYKAIGYEDENGKKVIQNLVPIQVQVVFWRCKFLTKSAGRYFPAEQGYSLDKRTWTLLFSFEMQEGYEAKLFMEWVVETVDHKKFKN